MNLVNLFKNESTDHESLTPGFPLTPCHRHVARTNPRIRIGNWSGQQGPSVHQLRSPKTPQSVLNASPCVLFRGASRHVLNTGKSDDAVPPSPTQTSHFEHDGVYFCPGFKHRHTTPSPDASVCFGQLNYSANMISKPLGDGSWELHVILMCLHVH